MRIGVLCPAEIAIRRFMPALMQVKGLEFASVGVALPEERAACGETADELQKRISRQRERAESLVTEFGGAVTEGYERLVGSSDIQAVYIPLPPALHYRWAKRALESGKHVLLEKPFAMTIDETKALISLARKRGLALHENYMFTYHSQIEYMKDVVRSGALGELRNIRIDFGFPFRGGDDFRYSKELGGGALLDCGGYTLKLAQLLLGPSARVVASSLCSAKGFEVDLFGNMTVMNDSGMVAQLSFGMDNDYRCSIDLWGSEATLKSGRILTAPVGYEPTFTLRRNGATETTTLMPDDSFKNSIEHFVACATDEQVRDKAYEEIMHQALMVHDAFELANSSRKEQQGNDLLQ